MQKLFYFFTFFLFITAAFAQTDPKTYTISGISVSGAQNTSEKRVIEMSGLIVGEKITVPSIQTGDVIRRLWKEGLFSEIDLTTEKIVGDYIFLVINVKERDRIASFSFSGVTKGQGDDLREKINFIRGTILTESKTQTAKRIIRNFFIEKGFYGTSVDITSAPDNVIQNGVAVSIKINKGKRIKINKVNIDGNSAIADKKLIKKLKGVKERKFWRVWAKSKYIPKDYETAKEAMISFYNDKGFRDARVLMDTVYNVDTKSINIDLKVYEGKKYFIRDINWVGNYKYSSIVLRDILNLKRGDIYSNSLVQKRLTGNPDGGDVSSLYLDDGYLFFNIDPIETLVEGDSIDLEMRVFEGPQATIRKIILEGNTKTSDYVILRELRTVPGEKFRRSDLIRSQREILNLGYFDQEKINVVPIPDFATGTVDIKYVMQEKPSDQLQLQGGWGGRPVNPITGDRYGSGLTGTFMLSFNNFSTKRFMQKKYWQPVPSGDGQKLNLSLQATLGATVVSASFMEPWFGGKKPNSLGCSASYSLFNYGIGTSNNYRNGILNLDVDYGRRLKFPDDFFNSFTSVSYKYFDITNPATIFPGFGESPWAAVNQFSLKQVFSRSSIDAPLYPRSGSTMTFSIEASPPYSLFRNKNTDYAKMTPAQKYKFLEFHRWRFSSDWYFRIVGNLVLRTKVDAGYLGNYNKKLGTSPLLRYYLGGSGMMGMYGGQWDGREVIALRGYPDLSVVEPTSGNGYAMFNKVSMELRYPITLNQSAPIWLLTFAEAANGYTGFKDYNPFRLHRSVGIGGRIMLPMVGLLGLDYGIGFDPDGLRSAMNPKGQFHFVLGQSF